MSFLKSVRTKMIVRAHFRTKLAKYIQNMVKIFGHILRFSSCSRLQSDLNWNIGKILHKMQRFSWDFSEIQQKLPVLRTLGRLHGLRDTNEWRRRRTARLYVQFVWRFKNLCNFYIQKVSHGHFRLHRFELCIFIWRLKYASSIYPKRSFAKYISLNWAYLFVHNVDDLSKIYWPDIWLCK